MRWTGRALLPWCLVLLFLAPAPAVGQVILGVVYDTTTGGPIPSASVTVTDEAGRVIATVTTDTDGRFRIVDLSDGSYILVVRQPGYRPSVVPPLILESADTVSGTYYLHRLPFEMDPLEVQAEAVERLQGIQYLEEEGFYKRSRRTDGRFVGPDLIDRRRDDIHRADDFLSGHAMVMGRSGTQRGYQLRCGRPRLFLDGRRFYGDEFDQAIPPDQVLAIEIYDLLMESQVFDIFYGRCAVVVWTREQLDQ